MAKWILDLYAYEAAFAQPSPLIKKEPRPYEKERCIFPLNKELARVSLHESPPTACLLRSVIPFTTPQFALTPWTRSLVA